MFDWFFPGYRFLFEVVTLNYYVDRTLSSANLATSSNPDKSRQALSA